MSYIIKMGAQAQTDVGMKDVSKKYSEKALTWHAGFYAGLFSVESLTEDELDILTNDLSKYKKK